MARPPALRLIAGPRAYRHLQEHGLQPDHVRMLVGASGGPKWLSMARLDEFLFGEVFGARRTPLQVLGSSAGAWRFACFAQADPVAASRRFAVGYQTLHYPPGIGTDDITRITRGLLDVIFPDADSLDQVLRNPVVQLNLIACRARGLNAARSRAMQTAGLLLTALGNAVSRRCLGAFYERIVFHRAEAAPLFCPLTDLPTRQVALSADNLRDAVIASGAIPLVLEGVRDIAGAGAGIYYDGGITDYHFDLPFCAEGLVLYPHFYPQATPGWFDKSLPWRHPRPAHYDNVVMLCPSTAHVAALPHGRIPDRRDFTRLPHEERVRAWGEAMARSEDLVTDLQRILAGDLSMLERWPAR